MSRYQPPPRDRSPPRFSERRPSGSYSSSGGGGGGGSGGGSGLGSNSYRASNDPGPAPIDRAPPRGPKAESSRGSYQYGASSRGRGAYPGRADSWDRDHERDQRDSRTALSTYRRDDDRSDWSRRDRDFNPPERGPSSINREARPYGVRDRSASPTRPRQDSKDSAYGAYSRPTEGSSYAPSVRGGAPRARGREWDRSGGRSSFGADRDRDPFPPRSISRDSRRERERDRDRDATWLERSDKRDLDRSRERDSRSREYDSWQRERPPSRQGSDSAPQNLVTPTTATSAAFSDGSHGLGERTPIVAPPEGSRRPSIVLTPASHQKDPKRELDGPESFSGRSELHGRDTRMYSPAPVGPISTSASLDYGPPPGPATSEKTPTPKVSSQKLDVQPPTQPSFQPPTGPKAERNPVSQNAPILASKTVSSESWSKSDAHSRPLPSGPSSAAFSHNADVNKAPENATESRSSLATTSEKVFPPGVPLGPRSSNVAANKPRPGAKEAVSTSTAPIAPKGPSKPLSGDQRTSIPTGPRLWASDNKAPPPSRPSIMAPLNKPYHDRSSFSSGSQRPDLNSRPPPTRPRIFQPSIMNRPAETASLHDDKRPSTFGPDSLKSRLRRGDESDVDEEADMSMKASSEDEVEDEDALDEDDFRDSEEKHKREIKALEARKPPPLLKDPVIVSLLIRIQMLGMIVTGAIPPCIGDKLDSVQDVVMTEPSSTGLLSPKTASDEDSKGATKSLPIGRSLKEPPVNPIPTPPIDDLPFLRKDGLLGALSFDDSDDEVEREAMATLVQQDLEQKAWEWRDEIDVLRNAYRENYLLWKSQVQELEMKRELRTATPAPASPAPSATASITPLVQERTRGARNATEADIEAVMRLSEQSAREEQEKRERETSEPNYETEAVLPAMLQPSEVEMQRFKDTNKLIPLEFAIDIFGLIPPVDDFTQEEQNTFISTYIQYPKKFGKISEKLPGRTYQQCIMHYYLTKDEANYKENFRRVAPKRGRRRLPPAQARANALLTESIYQDETESTPMTDSGRPRRAAAPTFGDSGADSETTQIGNSSKRTGSREVNGELVAKATRGRKAGAGPRTKRTKAQVLEDQRLAQAQSTNGVEGAVQRGRPGRPEKASSSILRGNFNTRPEAGQHMDLSRGVDGEPGPMQPHLMDYSTTQPVVAAPPTTSTPQIGSYWSVPEQQKFPELIAYFGRDFAAIADFMKTKTVVMIKNYYQKQLDGGKKDLEHAALLAEEKRLRGEPLGPPPTPIAPLKRRYESTPSTASAPRNIVSAIDHSGGVPDPLMPKMTPTLIDDFDPNTVQRGARGEIISKPREALNPAIVAQQRIENPVSHDRNAMQPQRQIPQTSFFRNERDEHHSTRLPMSAQEPPIHPHLPPRTIDLTSEEALQTRFSVLSQQTAPSRDAQPQTQHVSGLPLQPESASQAHVQSRLGHARTNNSISVPTPPTTAFERPPEMTFTRIEAQHRPLQFGPVTAGSPVMAQVQNSASQRVEATRTVSTPTGPPAEPPRPAQAKRSNIMNILNEDPPESQPPKRASMDTSRPLMGSSPVPPARQVSTANQIRSAVPGEDVSMLNRPRHNYDLVHQSHQSIAPPNTQAELGSPADWLSRFDPRPAAGSDHQTSAATPVSQSHYSVAPPPVAQTSNLPTLQRLQQLEITARGEPGRSGGIDLSHRRSILGQINHPGLVPSPPPLQQQIQPPPALGQPYRSASGSSQHSRSGSIGYGLTTQQPPLQSHPQHRSHSHSASSTPVSAVQSQQHRSHGSIGYEHRLSLGHPQPLQPQPPPSQVDLERERAERLRREQEIKQQVLRDQQASVRREREREMIEQAERERSRGAFGFGLSPAEVLEQQDRREKELREREMQRHPQPAPHHQSMTTTPISLLQQRDIKQERERMEREQPPTSSRYPGVGIGGVPSSIPIITPRRAETLGGRPMLSELERDREQQPFRDKEMIPRTFTPPSSHPPHSTGHGLGLGLGGFAPHSAGGSSIAASLFSSSRTTPSTQDRDNQPSGHPAHHVPPIRSLSQSSHHGLGPAREEKR